MHEKHLFFLFDISISPFFFRVAISNTCASPGSSIKLNPFSVKMLTMHRWFDISAAEKDLKYKPVIGFKEG
jgi:nucleoside-diphosphate-sugar epimerase